MDITPITIAQYAAAVAVTIFLVGLAASIAIRLIRSALRDTAKAAPAEETEAAK